MGMQNTKKGRASQRLERPAMLVNCVERFHRKRFLYVLLAMFKDLLEYMLNINISYLKFPNFINYLMKLVKRNQLYKEFM